MKVGGDRCESRGTGVKLGGGIGEAGMKMWGTCESGGRV